MIRLDDITLIAHRRAVLDRASFHFSPGVWHIAGNPPGDARLLIYFLAGYHEPAGGAVRCAGSRSWPLGQTAPFGPALSGLDIIDTLASLYALERRATFRLFRDLLTAPEFLAVQFDRWPQASQRQFGHIAFLAPAFDIYLLDVSPALADADFYPRWRALFRARIAAKTVIVASGEHRAALRDFPGARLSLSGGLLHGGEATIAMAAE